MLISSTFAQNFIYENPKPIIRQLTASDFD